MEYGLLSILPIIVTLGFAVIFRQVIPALVLGIWVGAFLALGPNLESLLAAPFYSISHYVKNAVIDPSHALLILFTFGVGGLIKLLTQNGGMAGLVSLMTRFATTYQRGQLSIYAFGLLLFFDDYANTLIVGKASQAIADRVRISREKLAYLVDSTSAPVASVAIVSSWIGFQVGLLDSALTQMGETEYSGYSLFLQSIGYSFYPLFTLLFVGVICYTGKDFGPMRHTQPRLSDPISERTNDQREEPTKSAMLALIPIAVLVFGVLGGIYFTGYYSDSTGSFLDIFGRGDSFISLVWAVTAATIVAIALSIWKGATTLSEAVTFLSEGAQTMLLPLCILVLAWAMAGVNDDLGTASYIAQQLSSVLSPEALPTLVFITCAITAFATGSSWGVMGIMFPLIAPIAWHLSGGLAGAEHILLGSIAAVLAGSVLGDHCSPISDTTILSSMATDCDHLEHVRTQLPYALTVGAIAIVLGYLPTGFGVPWWLCLVVGAVLIVGGIHFMKRETTPN